MFLSDRDLKWAIEKEQLIIADSEGRPCQLDKIEFDTTSIDLHLSSIDNAKVWDIDKCKENLSVFGVEGHNLEIGRFDYEKFEDEYLTEPPLFHQSGGPGDYVFLGARNGKSGVTIG